MGKIVSNLRNNGEPFHHRHRHCHHHQTVSVYVHVCICAMVCCGHRTASWSQFSPSTFTWAMEPELRSSELYNNIFSCWFLLASTYYSGLGRGTLN